MERSYIYYIGYVDTDKPSESNVNSVNPLYLIINRVYGSISERNGNKFLTTDKRDAVLRKYGQVFSGIKHHIKKLVEKKLILTLTLTKLNF